jgi:hypothetical protein
VVYSAGMFLPGCFCRVTGLFWAQLTRGGPFTPALEKTPGK